MPALPPVPPASSLFSADYTPLCPWPHWMWSQNTRWDSPCSAGDQCLQRHPASHTGTNPRQSHACLLQGAANSVYVGYLSITEKNGGLMCMIKVFLCVSHQRPARPCLPLTCTASCLSTIKFLSASGAASQCRSILPPAAVLQRSTRCSSEPCSCGRLSAPAAQSTRKGGQQQAGSEGFPSPGLWHQVNQACVGRYVPQSW